MFLNLLIAAVAVLSALLSAPAMAQEGERVQSLPVPRFVTLGADEVNFRTGPGLRYPIRLVVTREGLPVEVIREFDVWRQVRDVDGDEGWVLKSMLSGRRAAVVRGSVRTLFKKPDDQSRPLARLEPGVVVGLKACETEWCEVSAAGFEGWMPRAVLWGVYPDENFGGK